MEFPGHMIRSFFLRHYRLVFFLGLYLAYVVVLFGIAGAYDPEHASRSLVRLASPAVELGLAGLLCAGCLRMARGGRRVPWLLLSAVIGALAAVVYLVQTYSLYLSHNFITALAIQNADSAAFAQSTLLKAGVVLTALWTGLFWVATWAASGTSPVLRGAARWRRPAFTAATVGCALLFTYLLFLQGDSIRLEPGFRQSPVANLAVNAYRARFAEPVEVVAGDASAQCFAYAHDPDSSEYPFLRTHAYGAPLPFPRQPRAPAGPPNIIVIFAEGVSARLIGAYGGRDPGLTPNIDRLASRSMQVNDYFNHTAATFRGLSGQLSSGFSYAGGGGKEGWTKTQNQSGLVDIRRQTVPRIVNAAGYDSHFFAPHKQDRALILMLESLGFGTVHTYQSIDHELLDGKGRARPGTGALDDQSLFRGLIEFLQRRSSAGDNQPFFAATYNIGTHAFLASSENDVNYGGADNAVLDKLHNFDHALGVFLDYFFASPLADNTVLVFTADHATYPEPAYREVAGDTLKPYFVDRVPLLVYDPFHRLPQSFDAQGRNTLDLAPTLLQLAGLQTRFNSFLGTSLFESRNFPVGIAAMASSYYMTTPEGVFAMGEIPPEFGEAFQCEVNVVRRFYAAEQDNRIVPAVGASPGLAAGEPLPGAERDVAHHAQD